MYNTISEQKKKLIKKFKTSPLKVGELIYLNESLCKTSYHFYKNDLYIVIRIEPDNLIIKRHGYKNDNKTYQITPNDVKERLGIMDVGGDPFDRHFNSVVILIKNPETEKYIIVYLVDIK